jgi:hypothetical protein
MEGRVGGGGQGLRQREKQRERAGRRERESQKRGKGGGGGEEEDLGQSCLRQGDIRGEDGLRQGSGRGEEGGKHGDGREEKGVSKGWRWGGVERPRQLSKRRLFEDHEQLRSGSREGGGMGGEMGGGGLELQLVVDCLQGLPATCVVTDLQQVAGLRCLVHTWSPPPHPSALQVPQSTDLSVRTYQVCVRE